MTASVVSFFPHPFSVNACYLCISRDEVCQGSAIQLKSLKQNMNLTVCLLVFNSAVFLQDCHQPFSSCCLSNSNVSAGIRLYLKWCYSKQYMSLTPSRSLRSIQSWYFFPTYAIVSRELLSCCGESLLGERLRELEACSASRRDIEWWPHQCL